jgi:hypothetical protein
MQQLHARQLIFRIGYSAIIKRCSHNVNSKKNTMVELEHHDHTLICPRWEEAIIKEHRKSDLPFETMQKDTIDIVHNKNNIIKQQPYLESVTKPAI